MHFRHTLAKFKPKNRSFFIVSSYYVRGNIGLGGGMGPLHYAFGPGPRPAAATLNYDLLFWHERIVRNFS